MAPEDYGEVFDADNIPLSDDQMRAIARIPYSDTGKSIIETIKSFPLSQELQTGLTELVLTYLSKDAIFAHNQSVSAVMRSYEVSVITLDFLKSPKDAESKEVPPFLRNIRFLVQSRATRTVGGKQIDERTRQYNPTQRIEQVQTVKQAPLPRGAEEDEGGL